jgi:shikimate dehydrogenase
MMALHVPFPYEQLTGIVGRSLGHTLSPLMHNTAFKELNSDFKYGVFQVRPEMIGHLFAAVRTFNIRGLNVTIPYKQTVMEYTDELSDEASAIGAVNTVVNENGRLIGYNTDAAGVEISLNRFANRIAGTSVVIFGAGGAARAVIYSLATVFAPAKIVIVNRTPDHAATIVKEFRGRFPKTFFVVADTVESIVQENRAASTIVNTTSIGMHPDVNGTPLPDSVQIRADQIVFDIVYTPLETALIRQARTAGAQTVSGLDMLLGQGAKAFELFTQLRFPMEAARAALLRELTSRQTT